jgi:soluble lytic murein transglycosylase-like protein
MRWLGLFLCVCTFAWAGESVLLTSGSRLQADRHEVEGGRVRLYNGTGFIELDAAMVRGFEADEAVPPATGPAPSQLPSAAPADPPARTPQEMADAAADRYGVPRWLVRSIMAAESGFQPHAVSSKGAIGLMQLMPGTALELGADPNDPAQNVDAGARYLRQLIVKYSGKLWHVAAAYNAGPGAVDKYKTGVPPYRETMQYVNRIDRAYRQAAKADLQGTR